MNAEKMLLADTSFLFGPVVGVAIGIYFRESRLKSVFLPAAIAATLFGVIYLSAHAGVSAGAVVASLVALPVDFCIIVAFAALARVIWRRPTK